MNREHYLSKRQLPPIQAVEDKQVGQDGKGDADCHPAVPVESPEKPHAKEGAAEKPEAGVCR